MADKSKIEWTEATWNPIRGCSCISAGCAHCYAEEIAARFSGAGQAYEGLAEMTERGPRWTGEVQFVAEHLRDPLRWKRPRRIFVNSMSDLFHEALACEEIDAIFAVMSLARQHTFQVLTKRPERMLEYLGKTEKEQEARQESIGEMGYADHGIMFSGAPDCGEGFHYLEWPLPNVWLGVSVENQQAADRRIPLLLKSPAAVRWLSCEPLLGSIDLCEAGMKANGKLNILTGERAFIDWVVVGGESGASARPMHSAWARGIRDDCIRCGTPFFFKQWGEWSPDFPQGLSLAHREQIYQHGCTFYRVGKKKAGRVLDGRTWDEYPTNGDVK
jgi:protein gp37